MKTKNRINVGAVVGVLAAGLLIGYAVAGENGTTVSGPYEFKNLAVYLIHGAEELPEGVKISTLEEAMTAKTAKVDETGSVNSLTIENKHKDDYVFVLPGDIVKGGKQDRTLPNGFLLTPRSGKTPVDSFCVEQGRWEKRSSESVAAFSPARKSVFGKDLKLASKVSRSQGEVWKNVARAQSKLSEKVGYDVKSPVSSSSLQLTLENKDLGKNISAYTESIKADAEGEVPNAIGMAFAINGEFNSADIFGSRELFGKLWPKLLESAATEAVGEFEKENAEIPDSPKPGQIAAILAKAESDEPVREKVAGGNVLLRHETPGSVTFDTRAPVNGKETRIHRNVLAVTKEELAAFKKADASGRELRNQREIPVERTQNEAPNEARNRGGGAKQTNPERRNTEKRGFFQRLFGGRR